MEPVGRVYAGRARALRFTARLYALSVTHAFSSRDENSARPAQVSSPAEAGPPRATCRSLLRRPLRRGSHRRDDGVDGGGTCLRDAMRGHTRAVALTVVVLVDDPGTLDSHRDRLKDVDRSVDEAGRAISVVRRDAHVNRLTSERPRVTGEQKRLSTASISWRGECRSGERCRSRKCNQQDKDCRSIPHESPLPFASACRMTYAPAVCPGKRGVLR
jgi:hypothetical protein